MAESRKKKKRADKQSHRDPKQDMAEPKAGDQPKTGGKSTGNTAESGEGVDVAGGGTCLAW